MSEEVEEVDVCPVCQEIFLEKAGLRSHMKEVHLSAGKDYHCPSCKNNFSCKRGLKNHIIRYHNGDDNMY